MVICAAVDCKSHTRQWRGYFYKFSREENLKQQWVIKIKQISNRYYMPKCTMFIALA